MAYTLSTGEMTSFAQTNGQVRALAVSRRTAPPSTSRVSSPLSTASTRNRVAAFTIATGALTSFAPNLNSDGLGRSPHERHALPRRLVHRSQRRHPVNGAGIDLEHPAR